MPLKNCTKNGKPGKKWGDKGTCYTGPGAKKKALRQGRAIKANSNRMYQLLEAIAKTIGND